MLVALIKKEPLALPPRVLTPPVTTPAEVIVPVVVPGTTFPKLIAVVWLDELTVAALS